MKTIKIANAQAFWGDRTEAASELMQQQPDIDYLTLDYLSEVSLSIMAIQREKDPTAGYAKDFVDVVKSLVPFWEQGSQVKVIANAGGLNPKGCAEACLEVLKEAKCNRLKVGIVYGDDIVEIIRKDSSNPLFNHLETKESIDTILWRLTTGNAYLGARPIVEALKQGADIIITGRVADPSLTVAPCIFHFGWQWSDYHKIAQATVAGHLIECGTQVTGGISTEWLSLPETGLIGFPLVEIDKMANVVVTKPQNTGGRVSVDIIKEQLLYEIGDPAAYLSPDVKISFLSLQLQQEGENRVSVRGAIGIAPPETYKVSATYWDGYRAEGMLAIFGRDCEQKARRCGEMVAMSMKKAGKMPEKYGVECLGCGDIVPGVMPFETTKTRENLQLECILRICAVDQDKDKIEYFTKQIAQLVTCGPPGTTGYTTGRPHIRPVYGFWPCLIDAKAVHPIVEVFHGEN